jgi:hypothetical protein
MRPTLATCSALRNAATHYCWPPRRIGAGARAPGIIFLHVAYQQSAAMQRSGAGRRAAMPITPYGDWPTSSRAAPISRLDISR